MSVYCTCETREIDAAMLRCPRCGSLRWRSGQPLTGTSTDGYVDLHHHRPLDASGDKPRSTTHGRTLAQED